MSLRSLSFARLSIGLAAASVVGAQILHESGHLAVSLLFGRGPVWGFTSLVQLGDRAPLDPVGWTRYVDAASGEVTWLRLTSLPGSTAEWVTMLAAGPGIQLVVILAGLLVAGRARSARLRLVGLGLVLVNGFGMAAYYLLSGLRGIRGDEAQLAALLDLPPVIVALPFAAGGLLGLLLGFRMLAHGERRRTVLALAVGIIPVGPLLMVANGLVRDQVDAGHPLFFGVLGFSLPVVAVAVAAIAVANSAMNGTSPRSPALGDPAQSGDAAIS